MATKFTPLHDRILARAVGLERLRTLRDIIRDWRYGWRK